MPVRHRPAVVALVVSLVVGSLAVIGLLQLRSDGIRHAALAGTADARPTTPTTPTTASAAPAVVDPVVSTTIAEPAAVPDPEPNAAAEGGAGAVTVAGSSLRRGVARAVSSPATIADVKVSRIGLYSTPGQATADDTFKNPTWEGLPLVFLVQQRQGDWLEVELNSRPNHTTAWIRAADVSLRTTTQRVVVSLADRSLTVYDGQSVVMEAPVAIGTSATPTPRGNFYIDGAVRTPDPSGVYGPYQVSIAAFSEVLMTFGTGIGQIAMHGTNAPGLIGSAVSNGCLRMNNADVTRLANAVNIGTPVQIS